MLRSGRISFRRRRGRRIGPRYFSLVLGHVESLVDDLWHRLDHRAELLLHGEEVVAVVVCDEVDGEPEVSESPRAADAMEVGLGGLGEVEVYDDVHCLYVDASCEEVWGERRYSYVCITHT